MPVYDYKCADHGVFYELASMSESDQPATCPSCSKASARIIMLSPDILDMSPAKRLAEKTNERNQHEPAYSTKVRREEDHKHSNGCGSDARKVGKSNLLYTAHGEKMFPSMRPWMISH
ncbi:MAG: putative FmdB family regulatory protein [Candidatus Endobugula sp.]|jgi:putative FmdB family regulatory protein